MSVKRDERYTSEHPCPVCGGTERDPRGVARRCHGFLGTDGYAHCSREDHAGGLQQNTTTGTYAHRLGASCRCGTSHGGAEVHEIGRARRARTVSVYDYCDEHGELLFQVERREPKAFLQRRPDGRGGWVYSVEGVRLVPYRLPELVAAVAAGDPVHIVEGEKDADAIHAALGVATCNPMGAGKWRPEFGMYFAGAHVVIVRDRDDPGHAHARDVWRSVKPHAASVRVVEAREGKDAADHLGMGFTLDQFVRVWPLDESFRREDPMAWVQTVLRRSLEPGEPFRAVSLADAIAREAEPTWPSGLVAAPPGCREFRGVTILTGAPSAGKSILAVASAVEAARAGWHVVYLSAEMGDQTLARRIATYCRGVEQVPSTLHVESVGFGGSLPALVDRLVSLVTPARTLVVFDSVSSFVDQAAIKANEADVHQIGPLKATLMWALNVKRATEGHVSFLLLSEVNAAGKTKGRFGDHKADMVVALETERDRRAVKNVRVVKGWETEVGDMGLYGLDYGTGRLTRLE